MTLNDLNTDVIYTYADYFSWAFEDRVELIKGKVFKMAPPNRMHQKVSGNLFVQVAIFLEGKPCEVYTAPFDVRIPRKSINDKEIITVLQPDVCVVCNPSKLDKRGCIGAPDIVVEVLSPGNNAKELKNKHEVYEEAGVKEYWLVSPQNQWLQIHTLTNGKFEPSRYFVIGDNVASSVLRGFSISMAELFKGIDPEE